MICKNAKPLKQEVKIFKFNLTDPCVNAEKSQPDIITKKEK